MLRTSVAAASALGAAAVLASPSSSVRKTAGCAGGASPLSSLPRNAAAVQYAFAGPTRTYFTASQVALQQEQQSPPPPHPSPSSGSSDAAASAKSGETAMDVAMRVNQLKKTHQSSNCGGAAGKKQVEGEAWEALNSMTEEQVNTAEGKAVALLLNSWAYFAKYWERGRDGPSTTETAAKDLK